MSAASVTPRAGVIGLGIIGGGVAVSLAASGRVPAVYDIRPDTADHLVGVPAPLGSPAAVARASDVVLIAVVDAAQARTVLSGPEGVLAGAQDGLIVVLLCTVAVPVVRELADVCAAVGVRLLDCGVTPGDKAAQHGMVAIVGGDEAVVEAARPVLDDFAKAVVHCGPVGAGMATKIARNMITYSSFRAVREATALTAAAGVAPQRLLEVINEADPEGATLFLLERMRWSGTAAAMSPHMRVLMDKDLAAAQELAAALAITTPLIDTVRDNILDTLETA
ncbi:MAG: hypothetical protein JWQ81_7695 [Amycolatopsis sp.]|jgi:3-hydroxyisobutyrate dehydrogenase-like beta-hydroxyacid dehydrogenase|uniref:NAD(P)-dependent oxidoreductase n=1 Tax=Amycolatopsis sp. TaxID=37632 RepID=UPI00262A69C3|nr:NAD(P)-binding domain-containing protein [Amycolatopsis sp.]MCU1686956.1 hypothetical protein [Amycolatopsis sp.]